MLEEPILTKEETVNPSMETATAETVPDSRQTNIDASKIVSFTPEAPVTSAAPVAEAPAPVEPPKAVESPIPVEMPRIVEPPKAVEPAVPVEPPKTAQPASPVEPATPVEPPKAVEPAAPVEPPKAVEPVAPVEPPRPAESAVHAEPPRPAEQPHQAAAREIQPEPPRPKAADETFGQAASSIKAETDDIFQEEDVPDKKRFHFKKEDKEFFRDKWILSRISDENLMDYLKLEQRRNELQQEAKDIKEKRIFRAFEVTVGLAAGVAVVYLLKDNPSILVNILYIAGILGALWVYKNPKDKKDK